MLYHSKIYLSFSKCHFTRTDREIASREKYATLGLNRKKNSFFSTFFIIRKGRNDPFTLRFLYYGRENKKSVGSVQQLSGSACRR